MKDLISSFVFFLIAHNQMIFVRKASNDQFIDNGRMFSISIIVEGQQINYLSPAIDSRSNEHARQLIIIVSHAHIHIDH